MLGENIIAFDYLTSEKHSIVDLTDAALETENSNLKQTLMRMRNQAEQDHTEIYKIAEQNGWYLSATKANPQQISRLNNFFQQNYKINQQATYQGMQTGTAGNQQRQQQQQQQQRQSQYQQPTQYNKY